MSADQTARVLLDNGASPTEAIKIIRDVFEMRLGEAKATVHPHLSQRQQDAAVNLWDAAEASLDET
jgi:ribosomal protein L7/L12